jgi:ADP-ribosylglycohydrolase
MPHDATALADLLAAELDQAAETGHDVTALRARSAGLVPGEVAALLDELSALPHLDPSVADRYTEPSALEEIVGEWVPDGAPTPSTLDGAYDAAVHGAWLGRIAGNNLGKPVERGDHWTRERIRSFLELSDAYPITDYIPVPDPIPAGYELRDNWVQTTRGRVDGSSRDDDVDYTILGLHLLERHGAALRPEHVAAAWLERLPYHQVYTAERVAYRNLVDGLTAPRTATVRNPYREWIGALIRADVFGYVYPGDPGAAARLAYQDAALSHVANGIYGEMWAAALVSLAFVEPDPAELVRRSTRYVPAGSRLAETLRAVLASFERGAGWETVMSELDASTGHYSWVHTINNAGVIAAGILWGGGDFTRTVALTVQGGLDTDSNGATAGSVAGILAGADRIPPQWTEPLHDRVRSALFGFDGVRISDLAARTGALARRLRG